MKKKYRVIEGGIAWYWLRYWRKGAVLLIVGLLAMGAVVAFGGEKPQEQANTQEQQETRLEAKTEALKPIWDVPLDAGVQHYIVAIAENYSLQPELILAVIAVESNFDFECVGDNGDSVGLMQVQQKHHQDRMNKLGVVDLVEPYQNVLTGTDYLSECIDKGGIEWGLMCYNGGAEYANYQYSTIGVTDYAEKVLVMAEIYERERNEDVL